MGPLQGFLTTWSQARQTFGQGVPAGGSHLDGSANLRKLQADVESAAPGRHWRGGAATAYAAANTAHAQVFGKLADLDVRLAAEIDKSARVITRGRAELDDVRDRVVNAASSVPSNQAEGQIMLIVSKGLGQLRAVLSKTHGELNTIGAQIEQIGAEYARLGMQKFPP
ncbi:MAG: EspA/EspE family type VII secretion system effector [Mycobacterium sp.]